MYGNDEDFPSVDDIFVFIRHRVKVLENVGLLSSNVAPKGKFVVKSSGKTVLIASQGITKLRCPVCKGDHEIKTYSKFLKLQPPKRYQMVSNFRRCFRCLSPNSVFFFSSLYFFIKVLILCEL